VHDLLRLPKVDLHVHLEGAIRPATLAQLGAAHGVPVPSAARVTDSASFFAVNQAVRDCLRTASDFHRVAVEFCEDETLEGARYAEVTFTAAAHGERLGDLSMPLRAVLAGLAEGQARYGLPTRVVLDHSRRRPVERAWATLRLAEAYAGEGVVAVGLAGDESYPGDPFVEVFRAARQAGLHVVHHAGEAAGPASIRQAITAGGAERIGHGIRTLDDQILVTEVRERRIPLEVCVSSNVLLGLAASPADHPLPQLRSAGLGITVNTDLPAITGSGLAAEYRLLRDTFGYRDAVLAELAHSGVAASFAPYELKVELHAGIDEWLTRAGGSPHRSRTEKH
jgi:adenosine deaminase